MIIKVLLNTLIQEQVIKEDDIELYTYALECIRITVMPVACILFISLLMGMLRECIFLLLVFTSIRKYSGGFHAPTSKQCFIYSVVLIFMGLCAVRYLEGTTYLHITFMIAFAIILKVSPIESVNKPLDKKQKLLYKKKVMMIMTAVLGIYIVSFLFQISQLTISIAIATTLVAALQIVHLCLGILRDLICKPRN